MLNFNYEAMGSLSKLNRKQMVALMRILWKKKEVGDVYFLLNYNFTRFDKVITEEEIKTG
jgi:hypothetical protein